MSTTPPPLSPDRQSAEDADHLRLLAVFHFVGAAFAGLALLGVGLHYLFFHAVIRPEALARGGPPHAVFAILGLVYVVIALWFAASLLLNLTSGFCLLSRKSRTYSLVVAGLNCLHIPLGTVLGIFTIVVLVRPSVRDSYLS